MDALEQEQELATMYYKPANEYWVADFTGLLLRLIALSGLHIAAALCNCF